MDEISSASKAHNPAVLFPPVSLTLLKTNFVGPRKEVMRKISQAFCAIHMSIKPLEDAEIISSLSSTTPRPVLYCIGSGI